MKAFYGLIAISLVVSLTACSEEASEVKDSAPAAKTEDSASKPEATPAPAAQTEAPAAQSQPAPAQAEAPAAPADDGAGAMDGAPEAAPADDGAGAMDGAPPAVAGSETEAVIGKLGLGCKNRVLEQFDVPNSDITVRPGATLQQDIDSGAMTVADLKKDGASFNWEVSGKNASGYCNVDGSGTITEFNQW
jgi:hypothetical protein